MNTFARHSNRSSLSTGPIRVANLLANALEEMALKSPMCADLLALAKEVRK